MILSYLLLIFLYLHDCVRVRLVHYILEVNTHLCLVLQFTDRQASDLNMYSVICALFSCNIYLINS